MKKLSFLLFFPLALSAQTRQGTIVYERKIDVHRHLQNEQMKAMVPQFQTADYEIIFKDSIAVYKAVPKDEAPDPFEKQGGGGGLNIRFSGPGDDGISWRNYGSGRLLEETTLADKKYIITDTLHSNTWKLTDDTAMILGHPCKKATTTSPRGSKVSAWYAGDLPLPIGPDQFSGLPGVILKLDIDEGNIVFTAKDIQSKAASQQLKEPNTGRLITRADFQKKMDEVLGPPDAQGRRIIQH
jgi:GLPGLI family protein